MERLTERVNGKLMLKKQFPTVQDTLYILASRLELYEDLGYSIEEIEERLELAKKYEDLCR